MLLVFLLFVAIGHEYSSLYSMKFVVVGFDHSIVRTILNAIMEPILLPSRLSPFPLISVMLFIVSIYIV